LFFKILAYCKYCNLQKDIVSSTRKDSGGGILTSVILGEAEYSSYGKEAATKTRQRDIEAVGNRATARNHY
jgi:hypothetical protein